MQCPVCDERLREVERSGVMIDICPGCKGVWLDRGELEKLLQLADQESRGDLHPPRREEAAPREESRSPHHAEHDRREEGGRHGDRRERDEAPRRRRASWLSDILEGVGGGGD